MSEESQAWSRIRRAALDEALDVITGALRPIRVYLRMHTDFIGRPAPQDGHTHYWAWRCRRCHAYGGTYEWDKTLADAVRHCAERAPREPA